MASLGWRPASKADRSAMQAGFPASAPASCRADTQSDIGTAKGCNADKAAARLQGRVQSLPHFMLNACLPSWGRETSSPR